MPLFCNIYNSCIFIYELPILIKIEIDNYMEFYMKTKNMILIIMLTSLIASSESCYSMASTEDTEDTENAKNMGYMERARNWASNFINGCRYVGILPTLYASMVVYDFNKITGLDENKLDTYKPATIENAMARINT